MAIFDLAAHPYAFVTMSELAEYWRVSPAQILEWITAGQLAAIQLGPGAYRITANAALDFERSARVLHPDAPTTSQARIVRWPHGNDSGKSPSHRRPRKKPSS